MWTPTAGVISTVRRIVLFRSDWTRHTVGVGTRGSVGDKDWAKRLKDQLRAAGVPEWAPVGGSPPHEEPGQYYAWIESGRLEGRLLLADGADELRVLGDLIRVCNQNEAGRLPSEGVSVEKVALLVIRAGGGLGYGPLGRPPGDLVPFETLREFAVDALTALRNGLQQDS